jgi:hypothetical protein
MRTGFPFRNISSFDDSTGSRTGAKVAAPASTHARSVYVRTAEKISKNFRPAVSKNVARKNTETQRRKLYEKFSPDTAQCAGADPLVMW